MNGGREGVGMGLAVNVVDIFERLMDLNSLPSIRILSAVNYIKCLSMYVGMLFSYTYT